MSKLPTKPPTVESTMPKHEESKVIPPSPQPKAPPAPKHPKDDGRPSKICPGAKEYGSPAPKSSKRMIRVSRILTRFQDLQVEEDQPGDSTLLDPRFA